MLHLDIMLCKKLLLKYKQSCIHVYEQPKILEVQRKNEEKIHKTIPFLTLKNEVHV